MTNVPQLTRKERTKVLGAQANRLTEEERRAPSSTVPTLKSPGEQIGRHI